MKGEALPWQLLVLGPNLLASFRLGGRWIWRISQPEGLSGEAFQLPDEEQYLHPYLVHSRPHLDNSKIIFHLLFIVHEVVIKLIANT